MARPIKTGLDYFSMDTTWDVKMRLVKAKYKLEGVGLIIELFQAIYREGYALKWDEDTRVLFADENSVTLDRLDDIVGYAAEKGIFDQGVKEKSGYLTSHGIQARWRHACEDSKRKNTQIDPEIDLLSIESKLTPEETAKTQEETNLTPEESTHIKVKESKVNKIKEEIQDAREETPPLSVTVFKPKIETELFTAIEQTFLSVSGKFTDPPAEINAIRTIMRYVDNSPGDAEAMLATFLNLTRGEDDFWKRQPFTPSRLARPKIWDSVKAEAKKQIEDPRESWEDMETRLRAKKAAQAVGV